MKKYKVTVSVTYVTDVIVSARDIEEAWGKGEVAVSLSDLEEWNWAGSEVEGVEEVEGDE